MAFEKQAGMYIDFVSYYITKGGLWLGKEELLRLWKCYVDEGLCESHSKLLFLALENEQKSNNVGSRFALFQDDTATYFFNEILCNINLVKTKLTQSEFALFKIYMLWANEKEQPSPIKDTQQKEAVVTKSPLENIKGLPTLWTISFNKELPAISEQGRNFIVEIVERLLLRFKGKRKEITEKALEMALNQVKDVTNLQDVRIALNIIDAIIER